MKIGLIFAYCCCGLVLGEPAPPTTQPVSEKDSKRLLRQAEEKMVQFREAHPPSANRVETDIDTFDDEVDDLVQGRYLQLELELDTKLQAGQPVTQPVPDDAEAGPASHVLFLLKTNLSRHYKIEEYAPQDLEFYNKQLRVLENLRRAEDDPEDMQSLNRDMTEIRAKLNQVRSEFNAKVRRLRHELNLIVPTDWKPPAANKKGICTFHALVLLQGATWDRDTQLPVLLISGELIETIQTTKSGPQDTTADDQAEPSANDNSD
ncbi:MAG: hypothetical protein HJJLKODD_01383 [Phycisphaerae bacterium]|nr:hypothetical protein [Phycisphaerae bacterium]